MGDFIPISESSYVKSSFGISTVGGLYGTTDYYCDSCYGKGIS